VFFTKNSKNSDQINLQHFLWSVSGTADGTSPHRELPVPAPTDTGRHLPTQAGTYRHRPAPTDTGRHLPTQTGTDRPGLFYDVFDTHFVLNNTKRYEILKILIKYVIKQPGPVLCRSSPVKAGWGRLVPVPVVPDAADRPQETQI
jgi:hypothetical protein